MAHLEINNDVAAVHAIENITMESEGESRPSRIRIPYRDIRKFHNDGLETGKIPKMLWKMLQLKGAPTPPAIFTALNSTPLSSPSCPEHLPVELAPPPPPFADARPSEPLHQLVPPGVRIPIRSSCSPRRHGEVPSTGTPARPHSGELRPCAVRGSTMDRALSGPRVHRPGSPHFPFKNNSLFI
jgi:hypothetical protein